MFPDVAVAASLARGGSLSSSANRVNRFAATATAAAVFLLCCFVPIIVVAGDDDGPQLRFDIHGKWVVREIRNCRGFKSGQNVFKRLAPDLLSQRNDPELRSGIFQTCEVEGGQKYLDAEVIFFQECMEMTSTDGNDVHHWVTNGEYIIDDILMGQPLLAQATIEEPLRNEALDGATATMVLYVLDPESNPESIERINPRYGAKRFYINSDGNLVITRDMMAFLRSTRFNSRTKGTFIYERVGDILGCSGYDPDSCSERVYTDETRNWTVACCEEQGVYDFFESLLFPNRPDFYDGEDALGLEECEVPSSD
mmetsp:Transcript_21841/g.51977  ORF Transcript_21841/g.51977 Transcript_21841/m.51977 type:complete len:311 (+) Transcript_21841:166-1098(+)